MSYVTLDIAKKHLAVFHDADDEIIQIYINAAERYAADFMNRPSISGPQCHPWRTDPCCHGVVSDSDDEVPESVVVAVLLLTADYYENRSQTVSTTVNKNPAAESLLHFQRVELGV